MPTDSIKKEASQLLPLEAPQAQEELQAFVGRLMTLNHDINNCLAGIIGYLELAMMDADSLPPKTVELLESVQKSAGMLESLVVGFSESKRNLQSKVDLSALTKRSDSSQHPH